MYRILVADDEVIMLEAFKSVIAGAFGEECVVETAKTGRAEHGYEPILTASEL